MNFFSITVLFLTSTVLHYSIQNLFIRYKKFDHINHRSSHNTIATRTGGIGIFISSLLISLYFYFNKIDLFDYSLFIPFGIMFIIGVYDDFYDAHFRLKFFIQIIVAKILIDQGYIISNYYGLFGINEIPWFTAQLTTIFVFLIVVNAINFIDGIDGLAITEVIKAILLIEFFSEKGTHLSIFSVIIITSLVPLYYFNFKKNKKIFLGDGGSMLLGTIIMVYILTILNDNYIFKNNFHLNKTLFSVIVIFYPLLDLLRVFIIRISEGKSPFLADQNHLHHILFKKGFNSIYNLITIQIISILIFLLIISF